MAAYSCPDAKAPGKRYCDEHARAKEKHLAKFRSKPMIDYTSAKWRKLRARQLAAEPTCRECGQPATDVDHITSIRSGGAKYDLANLGSMCHSCHGRKTATHEGGFGNPSP